MDGAASAIRSPETTATEFRSKGWTDPLLFDEDFTFLP